MTKPLIELVEEYGQEKWEQGDNHARRGCHASEEASRKEADALLSEIRQRLEAGSVGVVAEGCVVVPREPSDALLMSMAIRYDHGLGVPGYYDSFPIQMGPSHAEKMEATLTVMRQLHEEVVGTGFHKDTAPLPTITPQRLAELEANAAISGVVWRFIDRMNDYCPQDTAEHILDEFTRAVQPHIDAAIDASSAEGRGDE